MKNRFRNHGKLAILLVPSLSFILLYWALYGFFGLVTDRVKPAYYPPKDTHQWEVSQDSSTHKIKKEYPSYDKSN